MPFHVTCVCDGPVPRNDTVERVARPYCLTKTGVLNVSASAIERAMFSLRIAESSFVSSTPMLFIGRPAPDRNLPDGDGAFSAPLPRAGVLRGFRHVGRRRLALAPAAAPETAASKETRRLFSCSPVISSKTLRARRPREIRRQARPWPYSGRRLPAAGSRRRRATYTSPLAGSTVSP